MNIPTTTSRTGRGPAAAPTRPSRPGDAAGAHGPTPGWFGPGLVVLAVALLLNTIVGPAITGLVDYPFTDTLRNETIGLELFAAVVLTPLLLSAAWLHRRQHVAAPVLALGPTAFVVYMFVQYIAGPGYAVYPAVLFPHLAIFVLAGALLVVAWSHARVPVIVSPRRWATVLGLFTLFVLSRYVDAYVGTFTGAAVPESYTGDLGMFWTVVLLDLGVVVPVAIATVAALLRGTAWADRATYGVLGWFAALVTGRMPSGIRNLGAVAVRYTAQANAYLFVLTDAYPHASPAVRPPPEPEPEPV